MKFILTVAVFVMTTSAFSASPFNCFFTRLDLKASTLRFDDWGVFNEKVTIFKTAQGQITAYNSRYVLISSPSNKSGWSGETNTLLTDLKAKKVYADECNSNE